MLLQTKPAELFENCSREEILAQIDRLPPEKALTALRLARIAFGDRLLAGSPSTSGDRISLAEFVRGAWPIIEPGTPLVWNWHLDAICEHLEAVTDGRIRRLLINIPPGHMKSLLVSVFWPAWVWTKRPEWRALFGSYAMDLAIRDSVRCRDIITSDWYQDTFRPQWKLKGDQNVKSYFTNSQQGFRFSLSVGGQATGWRGDAMVVDDPLNVKDQWSSLARQEALRWWDQTMSSRLNDQAKGARVIIMQRLHEEDLAGHVLRKGGYEHLCLPSRFEPERLDSDRDRIPRITGIGWSDPRTERNELLFPGLFPAEVIAEAEIDQGSAGFAGQHQQRPSPSEGGVFKKHWWRYWQPKGASLPPVVVRLPDGSIEYREAVELPERFTRQAQSWDCAFKDTKGSDFVAGGAWGEDKADKYLLTQRRDRLSFTATVDAIVAMSVAYPGTSAKYVEDKANGAAVIDTLRKKIAGLIAVEPEGGKISRANAVAPMVESGNVYLPHPAIAPWVLDYIEEHAAFPSGQYDDQVDQTTQILNKWGNGRTGVPLMAGTFTRKVR